MKFYIRQADGTPMAVDGKPVKIAGFEAFDFFYVKHDWSFAISEVSSGCLVFSAETLKAAKAAISSQKYFTVEEFAAQVADKELTP